MKLATALFVIASTLCLSGAIPFQSRVLDGGTLEKAIPYLVSITENTLHICGGFIYSPGWVITAASCVQNRQSTPLKVVVNEVSLIAQDPEEETIAVYQIFINSGYDPVTKVNDVALLKLASNVSTPTSCITYDEVLGSFGTAGSLAGWGTNIEFNGTASARAHNATLEVTADKTCTGHTSFNAATMICATSKTGVPCTHDEGSPLVMHKNGDDADEAIAVGVFSQSIECQADQPFVFTRLSAYYSWFINTAGRQPVNCAGGKPPAAQ